MCQVGYLQRVYQYARSTKHKTFLGIFFKIMLLTRDRKACMFVFIVYTFLLKKLIMY